jgi:stearoyl-CoA desaturase (delta-9 desaturase)
VNVVLAGLLGRLKRSRALVTIARWFDSDAGLEDAAPGRDQRVDWLRVAPFIFLHVMCLGVIWVGWSGVAVGVAIGLYVARMFAITGFYHRYFSHKAFKTSRLWQFVFAVVANSSVQRGPLWWAGHHRHHHRFADTEADVHSPTRHGFLWSHIGWITSRANFATKTPFVGDWAKFPELRWINRFDTVVPILLAAGLYGLGALLEAQAPALGTNGPQMLIWGFFISTVLVFHATATINSLDHLVGRRRYDTPDTSRNNWALALLTLGEGWHNNHHHYPVAARQGFFWWEIDITYGLLVVLSWLRIVRDLTPVTRKVLTRDLLAARAEGGQQ